MEWASFLRARKSHSTWRPCRTTSTAAVPEVVVGWPVRGTKKERMVISWFGWDIREMVLISIPGGQNSTVDRKP